MCSRTWPREYETEKAWGGGVGSETRLGPSFELRSPCLISASSAACGCPSPPPYTHTPLYLFLPMPLRASAQALGVSVTAHGRLHGARDDNCTPANGDRPGTPPNTTPPLPLPMPLLPMPRSYPRPTPVQLFVGSHLPWAERWETIKTETFVQGLSFTIVVYHTLCLKCFEVFRCTMHPSGQLHMSSAPEVLCHSWRHVASMVMSCIYMVVVLIGMPLFLYLSIQRGKRRGILHHIMFMERFAFVYQRYDPEYEWWECMLLLRRSVLDGIRMCHSLCRPHVAPL